MHARMLYLVAAVLDDATLLCIHSAQPSSTVAAASKASAPSMHCYSLQGS
jgi:hypothetical protein